MGSPSCTITRRVRQLRGGQGVRRNPRPDPVAQGLSGRWQFPFWGRVDTPIRRRSGITGGIVRAFPPAARDDAESARSGATALAQLLLYIGWKGPMF